MTTYDQAIATAGTALAEAFRQVFEGSPRQAAERAYTPGGPSIDELEAKIRDFRANRGRKPYQSEAA